MVFVSRDHFVGVYGSYYVVEELTLIASAWRCWLIASAAVPSGYSTGRRRQTGRTREQTVVPLLVAGRQLLGQVFVTF